MPQKLSREFYQRADTLQIARDLIGKLLVVPDEAGARVAGMIVETEAYLGAIDKAAHSFNNRRTPRNEIMYATGGRSYVFFIYGMYFQFNVVCGAADLPHAVLIRALEPVEGVGIMRDRRLMKKPSAKMPDKNLTSGPGKLCIALAIDRSLNGADLLGNEIWLEDYKTFPNKEIKSGKRIGIDYAEEFAAKPWRFWLKNNAFVSR
jgi:DNA-3-methyladenine glycosylase